MAGPRSSGGTYADPEQALIGAPQPEAYFRLRFIRIRADWSVLEARSPRVLRQGRALQSLEARIETRSFTQDQALARILRTICNLANRAQPNSPPIGFVTP